MPSLTHDAVIEAMRTVQEPELGRDLIALDMVKNVVIDGSALSMTIELTTPACPLKDEIERTTNAALGAIGATNVDITWGRDGPRSQPRQARQLVPGVKNIIAVASGKGGTSARHGQRQPRGRARPGRGVRQASSTPTSPARTSR
jgi:ATP-binding protein involved in chromosome partitioning